MIEENFKVYYDNETNKLYFKDLIKRHGYIFRIYVKTTNNGEYVSCFLEEDSSKNESCKEVGLDIIESEKEFWQLYSLLNKNNK